MGSCVDTEMGALYLAVMNRCAFHIFLLLVFVFVQGQPLHGHIHKHAEPSQPFSDHPHIQVHSHDFTAANLADAHHELDVVEIDLLGSAARDDVGLNFFTLFSAFWILLLLVAWVCIGRLTAALQLFAPSPLLLLHPSPRAPPL